MHKNAEQNFFYIEDYINKKSKENTPIKKIEKLNITIDRKTRFERLCQNVKVYFDQEWETEQGKKLESADEILVLQKKAIIGHTKEVNYFKDRIKDYLKKNGLENEWCPSWYEDLTAAIYHENWGLAGISKWKIMPNSSSAKVIGEKIFYLSPKSGKMELQEQKISPERLSQLRRALLLRNPEKRADEKYTEVYMLDGTRIIIFDEPLVKEATIIFRKHIIENFTLEEQAKRGTIPMDAVPLFKAQIKCGFNVNFLGPVRTGKTTFLETWQSYEEESLEGIQVETDPEVPEHILKPNSPIIQVVADGKELKRIIKSLVRSDADYMVMAEARDGVALNIAVQVANKGTRRVKSTFHTSDPADFCYDAANEIVNEFGGNLHMIILKVAKSYHYLYELIQLKDKTKKRLNAVHELRYNNDSHEITLHQIMKYNRKTDSWTFKCDIGPDKEYIGEQENEEAFHIFRNELERLEKKYPMQGNNVIRPYYNKYM